VGEVKCRRELGKFDSVSDANLFFRPGILDFDALASQVGVDRQLLRQSMNDSLWQDFFAQCSQAAKAAVDELMQKNSACAQS